MVDDLSGINFDAITVATVEITKGGRTWALRDDVPASVMARGFRLAQLAQEFRASLQRPDGALDPTQFEKFAIASEQEQVALALAIFQHTYPDLTREELLAAFNVNECEQIAGLFFQRRFGALPTPSAATDPSSAATEPTSTATQPATTEGGRRIRRVGIRSPRR